MALDHAMLRAMKPIDQQFRARLKQLAYQDAYGSWVTDRWPKEINYVFDRYVRPATGRMNADEESRLRGILFAYSESIELGEDLYDPDALVGSGDGAAYERSVGAILVSAGYEVRVTQASGEQGVDLLAERVGRRIAIQCKNYSKAAGNDAVQQVYAGSKHYGADIAIVVAPNGFTVSARQLASSLGVHCLHHGELVQTLESV